MTVAELINRLREMPQGATVRIGFYEMARSEWHSAEIVKLNEDGSVEVLYAY